MGKGRERIGRDQRSGRSTVVCGERRECGSCRRNVTAFTAGFDGGVFYEARLLARRWERKTVVEVEFSASWIVASDKEATRGEDFEKPSGRKER